MPIVVKNPQLYFTYERVKLNTPARRAVHGMVPIYGESPIVRNVVVECLDAGVIYIRPAGHHERPSTLPEHCIRASTSPNGITSRKLIDWMESNGYVLSQTYPVQVVSGGIYIKPKRSPVDRYATL
jgi:hypothetical protein